MNTLLLLPEVQTYIHQQADSLIDLNTLILAGSPFKNITVQELAQQIQGRRKAKSKLHTWYNTFGIYYPPNLNLEQTSSEDTARYKSTLISGITLIDMTGGFGIDDFYFSSVVKKVIHCELNTTLSDIAQHNFKVLEAHNVTTYNGDGLVKLNQMDAIDWIYIDPSRRHDRKGKVFFLEDCLPNVPEHLDLLFTKSPNILIKTAPLLDIQAGIAALHHVKEIHVVAVQHEVKELLWILDRQCADQSIRIQTINITHQGRQQFSFILQEESTITPEFSVPKTYLYEPNSAIMKSGGFSSITSTYPVTKLHAHSHLYTSEQYLEFPGRSFEIISVHPYQKKELKKLQIAKANITTRNFPESVATLRKKLKIKDGGDIYLFFTTDCNGQKIVVLCKKAKSSGLVLIDKDEA